MKDEALALVVSVNDPVRKLNLLREYVQAFVLRSLHESEAFASIAFVGGTALRFLESVPRFSEDLDFSVISIHNYVPEKWLKKITRDMELAGFECSIKWNAKKTVNIAWLRISELLHNAGLASRIEQNLSVKLEIDTRPPDGAVLKRTVINRHLVFAVCHYDSSSLFAGKVNALITRPYPKGRDWFDLFWFAARQPPLKPNLTQLQNALDQLHKKNRLEAIKWPEYVREKFEKLDVKELAEDVRVFLERPEDRLLITAENIKSVLDRMAAYND